MVAASPAPDAPNRTADDDAEERLANLESRIDDLERAATMTEHRAVDLEESVRNLLAAQKTKPSSKIEERDRLRREAKALGLSINMRGLGSRNAIPDRGGP